MSSGNIIALTQRRRTVRLLRPEEITEIAFVDKGANPEARITFTKRDPAQGESMADITLREACIARVYALADEVRKAHPELTKEQACDRVLQTEDGKWLYHFTRCPEAELPAHEAVVKIAKRMQAGDAKLKAQILDRIGI